MNTVQENNVSLAFSKQAPHFDKDDLANPILQWMREEIRSTVIKQLNPGSNILELNCGTGLDAVYFAEKEFNVLATDNAPGMLLELDKKIADKNLNGKIKTKLCSFNNLQCLKPLKFDYIFSNFGGLNCSDNLSSIIKSMDELIYPGGTITLVIMPSVCPWEMLLGLKGNFKIALRRFNSKGADSHLEGIHFKTYYYSAAYIQKAFGENYQLIELKALGSLIPPPQMNRFINNHPHLFNTLKYLEKKVNFRWPFYNLTDHFIISVRKSK